MSPWVKCLKNNWTPVDLINMHSVHAAASLSAESPRAISLHLHISLSCTTSLRSPLSMETVREWRIEERAKGSRRRESPQAAGYIRIQSLPWPIYLQPRDSKDTKITKAVSPPFLSDPECRKVETMDLSLNNSVCVALLIYAPNVIISRVKYIDSMPPSFMLSISSSLFLCSLLRSLFSKVKVITIRI